MSEVYRCCIHCAPDPETDRCWAENKHAFPCPIQSFRPERGAE